MDITNQTSSVSNTNETSGDEGKKTTETTDSTPAKGDTVSYETYVKLLGEKKKMQERFQKAQEAEAELQRLKAEAEENQKKELEKKGEFQKLLELERKRAEEAQKKLSEYEQRFTQGRKAKALLSALDNSVEEKFFDFLPIDAVLVDPETGEINQSSVAQVAEDFRKKYPELIKSRNPARVPSTEPQGSAVQRISETAWKKLDRKGKEKYKYHQINWGE
jgi:hypothetical protein